MKKSYFLFLMIYWLILLPKCLAADIQLKSVNEVVSANIVGIQFPEAELLQELNSGLPNSLDLIISISHANKTFHQYSLSYQITFDLWDEHYLIKRIDLEREHKLVIKSSRELFDYLANISISELYFLEHKNDKNPIAVTFRIFLNPIKSVQIRRIQNWIRTSNGYQEIKVTQEESVSVYNKSKIGGRLDRPSSQPPPVQLSGSNPNESINNQNIKIASSAKRSQISSSGPRFQKLFDKILEQHLSDDTLAAQWKSPPISKTFYLSDITKSN